MVIAVDALDPVTPAERGPGIRLPTGASIAGTYLVTRYLASGGSGHVFEVEQVRLGKRLALKLLRSELEPTARVASRFRREAVALALVKSEHVVQAVDCGELDDGTPYLVMELLDGEDLRSLLRREQRLPARRATHLLVQACQGVAAVHRAGLIHRDLKPENLFVTQRDGGEDWCKLLDFGVAKAQSSPTTVNGAILGTPKYMAPEQLTDGATVTESADVYALGAILYECLSGQPPFQGVTTQEVMYKVMNERPVPLSERCASLPSSLASAVMACLARDPSERPIDADALGAWLSQDQSTASGEGAATLSEAFVAVSRAPKTPHGSVAMLASASVFLFAAGMAADRMMFRDPPPMRPSRSEERSALDPTPASVVARPPQSVPPSPVASALAPRPAGGLRLEPSKPHRASAAPPEAKVGRFDATDPYTR